MSGPSCGTVSRPMCHHHIDDREWTFEEVGDDEDVEEQPPEPEDREPSFVEPGDPEVSLDREYEATDD